MSSYSRLLNSPERSTDVKEHAQLVASVTEVHAEAYVKKERKTLRNEKDASKREKNKATSAETK